MSGNSSCPALKNLPTVCLLLLCDICPSYDHSFCGNRYFDVVLIRCHSPYSSGCTKVGAETAKAAAASCTMLEVVNFNYTSVTPVSLVPLITACTQLQALKLAGIQNWARFRLCLVRMSTNELSLRRMQHSPILLQVSVKTSDFHLFTQ